MEAGMMGEGWGWGGKGWEVEGGGEWMWWVVATAMYPISPMAIQSHSIHPYPFHPIPIRYRA